MKIIFIFLATFVSFAVSAQIVNIPDANFKAYLVSNPLINTNGDSEIQLSEANNFTGEINCNNRNIANIIGIESFVKIKKLNCSNNFYIQSCDISKNTLLETFICSSTQISDINISKNTNLIHLDLSKNSITDLDITKNSSLKILDISGNSFTSSTFDISKHTLLESFICNYNISITNIDVSKNTNLIDLDLSSTSITNIDISKNTSLKFFKANSTNISNIDVSKNVNLELLDLSVNKLNNIDVTKNIKLKTLILVLNELHELNVDKNLELIYLDCAANDLNTLNLDKNIKLEALICPTNPLSELDLSSNINLKNVLCNNTFLSSLKINNGQNSKISYFTTYDNPNLTCIQVDDVNYSNANWTNKDSWTSYSTDCSLSVKDIKKSIIQIYPNPVKDKFIINTNDKIENIEIYSQTGQLLKTVKSKEINISNLPKGNYLVKIKTDKDNVTQKIIKE